MTPRNPESDNVAGRFDDARSLLSEAERIFAQETTAAHRDQWPNVYRLESATKHALEILTVADPHVTQLTAAEELVGAATQARDAIRAAVDSGGGDLIGSANRLLSAVSEIESGLIPPDTAARLADMRKEVESIRAKIETEISDAAASVTGQRDRAFADIEETLEAVAMRRQVAEQQASELGIVTSSIAAENLAEAYTKNAKRTENIAWGFTAASILTGLLSIGVAAWAVYSSGTGSELHVLIARAALGVPVALFAAYINSLANGHRREAWRLRHIELQIRTANPFLGLLARELREDTLAALALRFFPGQEGVSFDGENAANYTPELIELLRKLLQLQGHSAGTAATGPSTTT